MDEAVSIGDFGHDIDVIDPSPPLTAFDDRKIGIQPVSAEFLEHVADLTVDIILEMPVHRSLRGTVLYKLEIVRQNAEGEGYERILNRIDGFLGRTAHRNPALDHSHELEIVQNPLTCGTVNMQSVRDFRLFYSPVGDAFDGTGVMGVPVEFLKDDAVCIPPPGTVCIEELPFYQLPITLPVGIQVVVWYPSDGTIPPQGGLIIHIWMESLAGFYRKRFNLFSVFESSVQRFICFFRLTAHYRDGGTADHEHAVKILKALVQGFLYH